MNRPYKHKIIKEATQAVQETRSDLQLHEGTCLYFAHEVACRLYRDGHRPIIQAGSASWRIVPEKLDDGKGITHFSYIWSPHEPQSIFSMMQGGLPEMHVWVGLIEKGRHTIIDATTGYLPKRVEQLGLKWLSPMPPRYLWGRPFTGSFYKPNRQAVAVAMKAIQDLYGERPPYVPFHYRIEAEFRKEFAK